MSDDLLKLTGSYEGRAGAFRLYNDRYLEIEQGRGKKARKYKVDLLSLATGKSTGLKISGKALLLCVLSGGASAWMLSRWTEHLLAGRVGIAEVQADVQATLQALQSSGLDAIGQLSLLAPGLLLAIPALLALLWLVLGLRVVTRFKAALSGIPLVTIPRPLIGPGALSATKFVGLMHQRIDQCKRAHKVDPASLQAGEMKLLRRLVEARVIGKGSYESAKKQIFRMQAA